MLSRREFLRAVLLTAGSSVLAACSPRETAVPPSPTAPAPTAPPATPTVIAPGTPTAAPLAPTAAAATATLTRVPPSPTLSEPYLSVARGAGPAALTRAALDALGGIRRFVKSGDDVIVKPNICNASIPPELASTTNPEVVAEIVKLCLEAGARRVRVMDQPFSGTANAAYKQSGIQEAVERAGGKMEIMSSMKYAAVDFPAAARDIKSWQVYQDVLKADVLINVPIAKTHNLAKLTLGMKGLMGVILNREDFHKSIDQRVADLATVVRPTLTIVDGVRVLARNGPTSWSASDVVAANTVIASPDLVAADAFAAQTLFQVKPADIGYIRLGGEMGIGRVDLNNLNIKQVNV